MRYIPTHRHKYKLIAHSAIVFALTRAGRSRLSPSLRDEQCLVTYKEFKLFMSYIIVYTHV